MKLAIDIGNSNIVIGIFTDKWEHFWRLPTQKKISVIEYGIKINDLLWEAGINPKNFTYKILSSVVPELKNVFYEVLIKLDNNPVWVLDKTVYPQLPLIIPAHDEIGTDLVANALAVKQQYKENMIIVDFGTALTFTVVEKTGEILGVNIVPGLQTAVSALSDNTAQLDPVKLEFPSNPLGQNTQTAIQNGVLIGYTGLINHMIATLQKQLKKDYKVIITGGLSYVLQPKLKVIDYIDKNLTLNGLIQAGEIIGR